MNKINEDKGAFNILFQIPQILYSSVISAVINVILKQLSLSERQILSIKQENNFSVAQNKSKKLRKYIKIKLALFFFLSILLLIFFWYFISCFSAIYIREEHFGSNKVFQKPPPTFMDFIKEAIADKMIIILICCSIFEIGISIYYNASGEKNTDWIDGLSIIIAVYVVVLVGSVTNYKKEQKFHELNDIQNGTTKYKVIGNGVPTDVIADDILVGDLIKINYGRNSTSRYSNGGRKWN